MNITNVNEMNFYIQIGYDEYIECLKNAHIEEDDMNHCSKTWHDLYGDVRIVEAPVYVWTGEEVGDKGDKGDNGDNGSNSIITIMSLGDFFDQWVYTYEEKSELMMAYIVESLAMHLLRIAYDKYIDVYFEKKKVYPSGILFFDEKEMEMVPKLLLDMGIRDVKCNEAFVLIPQKTVVFRSNVEKNRASVCQDICSNCKNSTCEHRKSAYSASKEVLNYGYQRILGNKGNELWKRD